MLSEQYAITILIVLGIGAIVMFIANQFKD